MASKTRPSEGVGGQCHRQSLGALEYLRSRASVERRVSHFQRQTYIE